MRVVCAFDVGRDMGAVLVYFEEGAVSLLRSMWRPTTRVWNWMKSMVSSCSGVIERQTRNAAQIVIW